MPVAVALGSFYLLSSPEQTRCSAPALRDADTASGPSRMAVQWWRKRHTKASPSCGGNALATTHIGVGSYRGLVRGVQYVHRGQILCPLQRDARVPSGRPSTM